MPVFAFGENNAIETMVTFSGRLKIFSDFLYKLTRIRIVIFNGAGLFQQSVGLMPRRVPITTVGV